MPKDFSSSSGPNRASAPASPVQGQRYFNTTEKRWYTYDGTNWIPELSRYVSVEKWRAD